ncbi:hypothetical protein BSIN_0628 [Burkholderia singularis]|uniref:Uncharacterized protein n=1 Tax=Burkholderia singularis TaxID=1503053 RepID=A0A238H7J1_9BURK|nr:hypothetical protein BSIN_0628 [Burkholderia singularis]
MIIPSRTRSAVQKIAATKIDSAHRVPPPGQSFGQPAKKRRSRSLQHKK